MISNRFEPAHLETLDKATYRVKTALKPRIEHYEARLTKNWLDRRIEYFKTGFGEEGYLRTKYFLTELEKERVSTTERIIDLAAQAPFHEGPKLSALLKKTILEICSFKDAHIDYVANQFYNAFSVDISPPEDRSKFIKNMGIRDDAIDFIFHKITNTKDYGEAYLKALTNVVSQRQVLRPG